MNSKEKILEVIYEKYNEYTKKENFFCYKGCSLCCTQNVVISEVEGDVIYNFIIKNQEVSWLAEKLMAKKQAKPLSLTTNGFARKCLEQTADEEENDEALVYGKCPFLDKSICTIYPVRPFSCRSFYSQENCAKHNTAIINEEHLVINTVTQQIIEHLSQNGYWGIMLDVLLAMIEKKENGEKIKQLIPPEIFKKAQKDILIAEPIPGFLLKPEETECVFNFLQTIMVEKIGPRTIEEILNCNQTE